MATPFTWTLAEEAGPVAPTDSASVSAADLPRDILAGEDGDIALDERGDLGIATGLQAIRQDAESRLRMWLGEWFADREVGVDYRGKVLVRNPELLGIRAEFRAVLLATPGIKSVPEMEVTYDAAARDLSVSFRALSDVGELSATGEVAAP